MMEMTPIRRQYLRIKESHPDAIVLFRLGDFYEAFDEDASLISQELQIVLTSRSMGKGRRFPMAGIPHHALNGYLARLITRGHKVAVCEQMSDPRTSQGLLEREVVRVVTPGTIIEPELLEIKANNYLVSMVSDGERAGIAYVDITTSEFATTQITADQTLTELERLSPSEIIVARNSEVLQLPVAPTQLDERWFQLETARRILLDHFEVASLEGYGCAHLPLAIQAAGAIIHYLMETQKGALSQLPKLSAYSTESFMVLDAPTRRNLELFQPGQFGSNGASLLSVIDLTGTPMGGRLLRRWLGQPLLDLQALNQRQEAVAWFATNTARRIEIINALRRMADLERLINRIRSGIAIPRELVSLRRSLETIPQIKAVIGEEFSPLGWLSGMLKPCEEVVDLISRAIVAEPPAVVGEGGVIKPGFSPELDQIRTSSRDAKQYLADLERRERERTGIKSLKMGYNRVFGYYIEVTSPHLSRIPEDYIRKQTLVGAERFFTPELKEYESLILNAAERIGELETSLFRQVCRQIAAWAERILGTADALAHIDVFAAFAEVAVRNSYVQPQLTNGDVIHISGGRHPVVEQALAEAGFVPNDTHLSNDDAQLIVLTGPNMAGKSTYLRQVALIVLLAQIGSFVPADSAAIGLVDRIFTRVGLMDDLATGRSTFMIEMTETANILNNATPRSLIILDEIGRGTSTYDGLSIAQAVVEYIHNNPGLGAKTLFATHYHEMVELASFLPRVRNFNVAVAEEGGRVVFLRRIIPGGADRSYGIHVAQLAGLPKSVLHRAQEVLSGLEEDAERKGSPRTPGARRSPKQALPGQLSLFAGKPLVLEELEKLDIDSLSPLEAITKLYELRRKAMEESK
ncbi:DNA mismatch repair protein MutS [Dehalococcoidia bacterium]|nr:DNA mismatch repair protein MutS [Dehalococcoidia bacterium]MCL0073844.1 DNA mismatch repair protein MutS [Dehalococcoidia bacterium]